MQTSRGRPGDGQQTLVTQTKDMRVDTVDGTSHPASHMDSASTSEPISEPAHEEQLVVRTTWWRALKRMLPLYVVTHVLFLMLTYLSVLFIVGDFSKTRLTFSLLAQSWNRWDTGHFTAIAARGYDGAWRTAFFPLFPLLARAVAIVVGDPFLAVLLVSNIAGLVLLAVLYRLIDEDFDQEHAYRTTIYLAIFPTAFFFAAGYNESLFLCLVLLSFYYMRRGNWWVAGIFGFLASLTRSAGLLLLLPFLYEYLRQHAFRLRAIRLSIVSGVLIPAGLGTFALYCYLQFHDWLAFSHAQKIAWNRELRAPWHGLLSSIMVIVHAGKRDALTFDVIHNVIDLSAGLLMLALVILCFVGPWKFTREKLSYALYAAAVYLFSLIFPIDGSLPLGALSRYVLEIFPAFIVLAMIFKKQQMGLYYVMLSVAVLAFLLLQFLTGHWVI